MFIYESISDIEYLCNVSSLLTPVDGKSIILSLLPL